MKLLHILPRVPPAPDGVGDFALCLAAALKEQDIHSRFLVADPDWSGSSEVNGFPVQKLGQNRKTSLRQALKEGVQAGERILLHYVGYGYSPDGAPEWLADLLEEESLDFPLWVFVHEPWAVGPPWKRVFWTAGRQKKSLHRILRKARAIASSCGGFLRSMESLQLSVGMERLPLLVAERSCGHAGRDYRRWLILGQAEPRFRAVKWMASLLRLAGEQKALQTLVLAGRSGAGADKAENLARILLPEGSVETCYDFPGKKFPDELLNCGLALQHTQSTYLAKSTSFLTSLQLGQVSIVRWEHDPDPPFQIGKHLLVYHKGRENEIIEHMGRVMELENISTAARELYERVLSPKVVGKTWAEWLGKNP